MSNVRALALASLTLCAAVSGCLVDEDARCGDDQRYDGKRCVCEKGYGLVDTACVKCGKHEVGSLTGCACEKGYARNAESKRCEEMVALGAPCTTSDDCTTPGFDLCIGGDADGGGGGYCTKPDCKTSADCDTTIDYACNDRSTPSFCERPPEGLGTSCDDDSMCEGFAASYCESLSSHVCLVNECKADPDKCHGDWACCDIVLLGGSICVPQSELANGECPAGGTLIPRTK